MAKTRRATRGGFSLPSWVPFFGKPSCESARKKSAAAAEAAAAAKKVEDTSCAGESTAEETPAVADASAEMSGAPAAPAAPAAPTGQSPPALGGRSRRRRQTRRKYKGGKHRKGHY